MRVRDHEEVVSSNISGFWAFSIPISCVHLSRSRREGALLLIFPLKILSYQGVGVSNPVKYFSLNLFVSLEESS